MLCLATLPQNFLFLLFWIFYVLSVQLLNEFTNSMSLFNPLSSICISLHKNRPTPEILNLFVNVFFKIAKADSFLFFRYALISKFLHL